MGSGRRTEFLCDAFVSLGKPFKIKGLRNPRTVLEVLYRPHFHGFDHSLTEAKEWLRKGFYVIQCTSHCAQQTYYAASTEVDSEGRGNRMMIPIKSSMSRVFFGSLSLFGVTLIPTP